MPDIVITKKKDSRIGKTDRDIKRAMLSLVAKEPFERIRVEQIMAEAPVTKVTFYRHFTSKDDVLDAIRVDLVDDMITEFNSQPYKNLSGGVSIFYKMMDRQDTPYRRLFQSEEYEEFRRKLRAGYFSMDFFKKLSSDSAFAEIVPEYIADAAEGIYRRWKKRPDDKKCSLDELAEVTEKILMGGLNGMK